VRNVACSVLVNMHDSLLCFQQAVVLCEHLNLHPDLVKGKKVIELGAGTGLVGIVASQLGELLSYCVHCFYTTSTWEETE